MAEGPLDVDAVLGPSSKLARRLAGYEHREAQLDMGRAVARALQGDRHLFVEAGTGTGKTLAYLVPAVLSGKKVVISTATHALEEQIFGKDIPLVREVLAEHGIPVRAALMKGLSNYLCKRRIGERMGSGEPLGNDLLRIDAWSRETRTGDRAEIAALEESSLAWRDVQSGTDTRVGSGCVHYDECFVTRMRREAEDAQIVVVNHHLFFADLALRTSKTGFGGAIPAYDAVVFDEAHQIENIATDFFGVRISESRFDALVRDARRSFTASRVVDSSTMRLLDEVESASRAFFRSWSTSEGRRTLGSPDWTDARRGLLARVDLALEGLFAFALSKDDDERLGVVARRAEALRADAARVMAGSASARADVVLDDDVDGPRSFEGGVVWLDSKDGRVALGASPVELGPLLRTRLWERVPSVVCTSATLATGTTAGPSFHFAKGRLGAPPDTDDLAVPSPFDFARRAALYVAEDLPEPTSPEFDDAAAARAAELCAITGGGAFVLCTSVRAMRRIHQLLVQRYRGDFDAPSPVLVQGEAPKHVLLERFRASGKAVLVATMSFWEGVDVPGHALRLVVIDKVPFAVPTDPIVLARSSRIEAEGGNPFTQYAVPSAAITLKQGFGRLIRTRTDGGVVALLDRRATKRGYGRALLESLPPATRLRSLDAARAFFEALDLPVA